MTVKASDIEVLEGLESVRRRPGMYIGPVNTEMGVFNWAREPIDNVIDEWAAGRNDTLYVKATTDEIIVADKGVGIPVEKHPKKKISTLTLVFTTLHAGAKFGSSKSYKAGQTTGMHGVGVSVTNALALELEVWTKRDGKWFYQRFERGEPVTKVLKKKPPFKWPKGTVIRAVPDRTILKTRIPIKLLEKFLVNLTYLCPSLKITWNDKPLPKKNKLSDLLTDTFKDLLFRPYSYETDKVKLAVTWRSSDETQVFSFVNYLHTRKGGTHVDGLKEALVKAIRALDSTAQKITPNDLLTGLCAAIHVHVENPNFDSQTKEHLDNIEVKEWLVEELVSVFQRYFAQNRSALKKIIKQAKVISDARRRFKEEVTALKKASREAAARNAKLPAKLLVAPACRPYERELFIVEGDSAGGTCRDARDKRTQEILPIRGKTLNIARASAAKLFKNEEFLSIIKAIGCGVGKDCRPEKARVGKVIILTDADPDGYHIRALLITFFVKYMKELVKKGRVYVVDAPLYVARKGNKKVYGNSLNEIERKLGSLKGALVTRMKGWAEASADDLKEIALSGKNWIQLKLNKKGELVVDRLMGSDTTWRKMLLIE